MPKKSVFSAKRLKKKKSAEGKRMLLGVLLLGRFVLPSMARIIYCPWPHFAPFVTQQETGGWVNPLLQKRLEKKEHKDKKSKKEKKEKKSKKHKKKSKKSSHEERSSKRRKGNADSDSGSDSSDSETSTYHTHIFYSV